MPPGKPINMLMYIQKPIWMLSVLLIKKVIFLSKMGLLWPITPNSPHPRSEFLHDFRVIPTPKEGRFSIQAPHLPSRGQDALTVLALQG